jgi:hypothetical protein
MLITIITIFVCRLILLVIERKHLLKEPDISRQSQLST